MQCLVPSPVADPVGLELHARVESLASTVFYETARWSATDRLVHAVEHGISYDERLLVKHLEGGGRTDDE